MTVFYENTLYPASDLPDEVKDYLTRELASRLSAYYGTEGYGTAFFLDSDTVLPRFGGEVIDRFPVLPDKKNYFFRSFRVLREKDRTFYVLSVIAYPFRSVESTAFVGVADSGEYSLFASPSYEIFTRSDNLENVSPERLRESLPDAIPGLDPDFYLDLAFRLAEKEYYEKTLSLYPDELPLPTIYRGTRLVGSNYYGLADSTDPKAPTVIYRFKPKGDGLNPKRDGFEITGEVEASALPEPKGFSERPNPAKPFGTEYLLNGYPVSDYGFVTERAFSEIPEKELEKLFEN